MYDNQNYNKWVSCRIYSNSFDNHTHPIIIDDEPINMELCDVCSGAENYPALRTLAYPSPINIIHPVIFC